MTEHIKTPELRFSNFLDMWHIHKLSDVATITGGGTPSTKVSEYWDGEIDWYTPNEIGERIYARGSKKKITNLGYKKSSTKLLPINTILFTSRAGIGNTAILAKEGCTNQGFQSIIPNSEKIDSYFIYTISNHIKKYALKHAAGSTFLEISGKELGKMKLFLPSLKEQQKIGNFFSKLDRHIELEEEKLELLEQQKRGYMQKIFSQELRFKDDNGNDYPDWEETTLKNITNYISSKKSSNQYNESNNSEGYPVYDAIQEIGKDLQYDMKEPYISILKDGAGVGRLNLRAGKSSVIGTMGYIQANNVDIQFLYYRMKLLNFRKFIIGSTIPHLYYKDYSKEKILIPTSNDEQKKIGHFILNIDKLIDNKTLKLDYLKQRKQGLLQKMFV